ncbi:BTAD domain-containing putative transcriptional regulator [Streptacidiphilus monticola]
MPGPWAERRRILLTDDRLAVREARLGHDLALGRHAEAAAELEPLCAEHPVHESLWALRIRALLGCGRPQEAKQAYTAIEAELDERLGVDPGPALTSLRAQLDAGAGAAVPSAAATTPASGPPPGQLPADTADFTGRTELADRLCRELAARPDAVLITGGPGVGRTALAVHVAHRLRGHFPDGQLHADLRASTCSPPTPARSWPTCCTPSASPGRSAALHRGPRGPLPGRTLRAAAPAAVRRRPGRGATASAASAARRGLRRARHQRLADAAPRAVPLDPLTPDESVLLLSRIAGAERIGAEPAEAARLAALCGHLPLALRIAGGRLAARPQWTVAHLAARLDAPGAACPNSASAPLRGGSLRPDPPRPAPEQAAAFRQLASAPVEDFTPAEAAGLLAVDRPTALALLQALADRSLLDSPAPDSYRCPELLRLHAGGLPSADAAADPAARPRAPAPDAPRRSGPLSPVTCPPLPVPRRPRATRPDVRRDDASVLCADPVRVDGAPVPPCRWCPWRSPRPWSRPRPRPQRPRPRPGSSPRGGRRLIAHVPVASLPSESPVGTIFLMPLNVRSTPPPRPSGPASGPAPPPVR